METTTFPRTGRRVGRLGFGAMGFAGWFGDQPEADHVRALHHTLVVALERRTHERLRAHRLSGEWFGSGIDLAVGAAIQAAMELGAELSAPQVSSDKRPKVRRGAMLCADMTAFLAGFGEASRRRHAAF